jgi:hypothetical protein
MQTSSANAAGIMDVLTALQEISDGTNVSATEVIIRKPDGTASTLVIPDAEIRAGDMISIDDTQKRPTVRRK